MGYTILQSWVESSSPKEPFKAGNSEILGIQSSSTLQNENITVFPTTHFYWIL